MYIKGQIPWYSEEGHLNMAGYLFSKECDGTIVTPTVVVEPNKEKFQGSIIVSHYDHGIEHLKLIHRDGVSYSPCSMIQRNGFRFHTNDLLQRPTPKVKNLNDSCHSALLHGRLGCAGNSVTDSYLP